MSTAFAATRLDLQTRLIERCWKDPDFRKEVIADPKGLLEKQLGQKLPEDVNIFIHEDDSKTLHFSLPPSPSGPTELSDEELEKVAGGTEITIVVGLLGAALGGAIVGTITVGVSGKSPW